MSAAVRAAHHLDRLITAVSPPPVVRVPPPFDSPLLPAVPGQLLSPADHTESHSINGLWGAGSHPNEDAREAVVVRVAADLSPGNHDAHPQERVGVSSIA